MSYTVYKITSPNGRSYIGVTKLPLETRWANGRGYAGNTELHNDIIQYGWLNFTKEVLLITDDVETARQEEHRLIREYADGYNIYRAEPYIPNGRRTPPKPVRCVETGVEYNSIKEAARRTGLSKNKISYCCRGIRNKTGGYSWEFAEL